MADLAQLLESALHSLVEGIVLVNEDGRIAFWNCGAESITGRTAGEINGRHAREIVDEVVVGGRSHWIRRTDSENGRERGSVVRIRHKLGVEFPVVARTLVLRDPLGRRCGTGVSFHPVEKIDEPPTGDWEKGESRREIEERLTRIHEDFRSGESPFGILWVTVDQAPVLRRSHGKGACDAMLESIEKTLASGLKPAEEIGRWGDQDFLILSHERSAAALVAHGKSLAGLARTTDFRWWGDRISLTLSIGAAQAATDESLCTLLERAESAMLASIYAGGNQTTAARGNE